MQSRNFRASTMHLIQLLCLFALATMIAQPADATNNRLPRTTLTPLAYRVAMGSRNGLPPTTMDSFVANAIKAGRGDAIYGDEGIGAAPPPFYEGFTKRHRINAGIVGQQDVAMTTGHGSPLPDAWGRDERLGQEWSQSGPNGGAYNLASTPNVQSSGLDNSAGFDLPPVAPHFARQAPRRAYGN